jgi:H+-transporting ATPase
MQTTANKVAAKLAPSKPANAKPPDIASASVSDALATLKVNPETGLTHAEVDTRRKENGYNEVTEKKGHPVVKFLKKFWGISAWMLELIMVLSAVLGKYSDLIVVSALLVINAVLSFMQEPGCRCRRGTAETAASQCAGPARFELASYSRPGVGPRRYRPSAPR